MDMFKAGLKRKIQHCAGVLPQAGSFNVVSGEMKIKRPGQKTAAKVGKEPVSTYQIKNKCLKTAGFTNRRLKTPA